MKQWLAVTCPVCGFRYPLSKFAPTMKPILYILQIVTGGGRARGFRVVEYVPWSALPSFAKTETWNSLLCLYGRLATAYDHFYETLGFMSPKMRTLLQSSYAVAYKPNSLEDYTVAYSAGSMSQDIVESYTKNDISDAYSASLLSAFTCRC